MRDRLNYAITAFLPDKLELLNLQDKINLIAHFLPDTNKVELSINDRRFDLPIADYIPLPSINENRLKIIDIGYSRKLKFLLIKHIITNIYVMFYRTMFSNARNGKNFFG